MSKCKDPISCGAALQCLRGCEHEVAQPAPDTVTMVAEFHRAFDYEIPEKPCVPGSDVLAREGLFATLRYLRGALNEGKYYLSHHPSKPQCLQRPMLILEELIELCEAMISGDMVKVLDACEDLQYVNAGTIVALGLMKVHGEGFRRVHASNMSKLKDGKAIKDENGKVVKGDWYKPVDLSDLVV